MIHVALVSAYPTEAEACAAIAEGLHTIALGEFRGTPYRGIWIHPTPEHPHVHVFSRAPAERLEAAGWTRPEERA